MNITNYFAVEPIIVNHIAESMPELIEVDTPFDIEDMLQTSNNAPAVSVIWHGERMGEVAGKGKLTAQYQQWLIVLKVRDASAQSKNTNSIRKTASPYILRLLDCMQGFDPKMISADLIGYKDYFRRGDCPVSAGSDSGFAYFPFLFEIQMFI